MYLPDENKIWVATADDRICMIPRMANRHGLVAGASGTGKTVTIKVLAESFSDMGVPVFLGDIKGDVSGMCMPGVTNKHIDRSIETMHIENFSFTGFPVRFFDVFGEKGIPVRTTVSDMGPVMLSRILELNDTQSGILNIIFKIADDNKMLLIDMKDLRAMVQHVGDNNKDYQAKYGNIAAQSVGAIQRQLVTLEGSGGDIFFGEPALDIKDWMSVDQNQKGYINILDCVKLVQNPLLYSTFLLWMLTDLYETLPEAGDPEKPKMVFFFDEAHLLFGDASKALLQKVEQIARLIRSKGVGVYFITQVPADIPDTVLSQLGNKIQHALRAYTPKDQKAVRSAAASFRANPKFDCEEVLGQLGTGEALVSLLDENGAPQMVERAYVMPPRSFLGVADEALVRQSIQSCPLYSKYNRAVDRESAYEQLQKAAQDAAAEKAKQDEEAKRLKEHEEQEKQWEKEKKEREKEFEREMREKQRMGRASRPAARKKTSVLDKAVTNTLSSIGREAGKELLRGLFGNLKK